MKLMFLSDIDRMESWRESLTAKLPELEFVAWPDEIGDPASIDYALVWKPPTGELAKYSNLKAILSLGAGIDHLSSDPELPRNIPVVRLVDRCLTQGMTEYILYWVIHYHRRMGDYAEIMAVGKWRQFMQRDSHLRRVGLLGLGELGSDAAAKLAMLEFDVAGWSRSPKDLPGVTSYHGADDLDAFLARTEILICLLPMTDGTRGIINNNLLAKLPAGAFIINAARGGHVVDDDLLAALDSGHIAAATLDVFHTEPLPADHPFWSHPKVTVTPHIASMTVPHSAVDYIADNIRRIERGETPLNVVNMDVGY